MSRVIVTAWTLVLCLGAAGCGVNQGTAIDAAIQADGSGRDRIHALAEFAASLEGFSLATDENPANLAVVNGGVTPTLTWDGGQGSPEPGSLQVIAQYLVSGRYVDGRHIRIERAVPAAMNPSQANWSGRKLSARFRVGVGLDSGPDFSGHATLYVATVDQVTGLLERSATTIGIAPGADWQTIGHPLESSSVRLPVDAYGLIFELRRGGRELAGTPDPSPSVFHIDTFVLE